jgi:hypothetical protein
MSTIIGAVTMNTLLKTRALLISALVAPLLLAGCGLLGGGGDGVRLTPSDFYNQYLPVVRTVHHPDSSFTERDISFGELRRMWSVNHTQRTGPRDYSPGNFSSFATLWSRDLSARTASLRMGLGDLSEDVRERVMSEQMEQYEEVVAFEVHMFVPATRGYTVSDTHLRAAGMSITLQDDQRNEYRPFRVESDAAEEFQMMPSQVPVYHRSNRVYFERNQNGTDILEGVENLRLVIRTSGTRTDELWFSWRFNS